MDLTADILFKHALVTIATLVSIHSASFAIAEDQLASVPSYAPGTNGGAEFVRQRRQSLEGLGNRVSTHVISFGDGIEEATQGFESAFEQLFGLPPSCKLPRRLPASYPDPYRPACQVQFRAYQSAIKTCVDGAQAKFRGGSLLARANSASDAVAPPPLFLHRTNLELCELVCKDKRNFEHCVQDVDRRRESGEESTSSRVRCTVEQYQGIRDSIDRRFLNASREAIGNCDRDPSCDPASVKFRTRFDTVIDRALREAAAARVRLDKQCMPSNVPGFVRRVQITSAVEGREPVDDLSYLVSEGSVALFTELENPPLDTIVHDWFFGDALKASTELKVRPGATKWRTWSSKEFVPAWAGEWTVVVRDKQNRVLFAESFIYRPL